MRFETSDPFSFSKLKAIKAMLQGRQNIFRRQGVDVSLVKKLEQNWSYIKQLTGLSWAGWDQEKSSNAPPRRAGWSYREESSV